MGKIPDQTGVIGYKELPDFETDINGQVLNYLNNPLIRGRGQNIGYTKEHILEIIRCKNDIFYFAESYYRITHMDLGIITIELRDYQKVMLDAFVNNRFNILRTSRQIGKSTAFEIYVVWYILFHEDKNIAILANKATQAKEVLGRIKSAYTNLPKWLQQGVVKWNEAGIKLENGCRVSANATSSDAIRGQAISMLILDEAAFVDTNTWSPFWTSIYPTISSSKTSRCIMVSTPNGMNHFYEFWRDAVNGDNNFHPVPVNWWEVPLYAQNEYDFTDLDYNDKVTLVDVETGKKIKTKIGQFYDEFDCQYQDDDFKMKEYAYKHDERDTVGINKRTLFDGSEVYNIVYTEWKEETVANQGMRKFTQEFGNQFLASADSLIEGECIRSMQTLKHVPLFECEPLYSTFMSISGRLEEFTRIFTKPVEGREYVLGVDPAKVTEVSDGDSLAIQVIDITETPIEQVAVIEIPTGIHYADVHEIIASIGRYYNEGFLFIENNDQTGLLILDKLLKLEEYENIYSEVPGTDGFRTTSKNKNSNVLRLKDLLENKKLILRDKHTVSQISTFIKKSGKYAAEPGYKDDLVMSLIHATFYLTDLMMFEEAVDSMQRYGVSTYQKLKDDQLLLADKNAEIGRPDLETFENAPMPMGSAADFDDEEHSVF